jgi:hypothetical protein
MPNLLDVDMHSQQSCGCAKAGVKTQIDTKGQTLGARELSFSHLPAKTYA